MYLVNNTKSLSGAKQTQKMFLTYNVACQQYKIVKRCQANAKNVFDLHVACQLYKTFEWCQGNAKNVFPLTAVELTMVSFTTANNIK
jgi:hypothetical protein